MIANDFGQLQTLQLEQQRQNQQAQQAAAQNYFEQQRLQQQQQATQAQQLMSAAGFANTIQQQREADARARAEFGLQQQSIAGMNDYRKGELDYRNRALQDSLEQRQAAQDLAKKTITAAGPDLAGSLQKAYEDKADSDSALYDAQQKYQQAAAQMAVAGPDRAKQNAAKATMTAAAAAVSATQRDRNAAYGAFTGVQNEARRYGYLFDPNNLQLVHPQYGINVPLYPEDKGQTAPANTGENPADTLGGNFDPSLGGATPRGAQSVTAAAPMAPGMAPLTITPQAVNDYFSGNQGQMNPQMQALADRPPSMVNGTPMRFIGGDWNDPNNWQTNLPGGEPTLPGGEPTAADYFQGARGPGMNVDF